MVQPPRIVRVSYAWREADADTAPGLARGNSVGKPGRARQWWLKQLANSTTRRALLERP